MKSRAATPPLPIWLVTLASVLALALIASLGWFVWDSVSKVRTVETQNLRLVELTGRLAYINEALWLSGRRAIESREAQWLRRYADLAVQRAETLPEFRRQAEALGDEPAVREVAAATEELDRLERQALDLANTGEMVQALDLLSSAEYVRLNQSSTAAGNRLLRLLEARTQQTLDGQLRSGRLVIGAVAVAITLLLFTWIVSLRISASLIARRRREEIERAEQARRSAFVADVRGALTRGANLRGVVEAMVQHLDASSAGIWILDGRQDEPSADAMLTLEAGAGLSSETHGVPARVRTGEGRVGQIARDRLPLNVQPPPDVPGAGAFAGYPLLAEDRVLGVMAMFARSAISESTLAALSSVADTVAQGIQRATAETLMRRYAQDLVQANRRLEEQRAALERSAGELGLARDAALESARMKSQFLANMSHEIRTPMTGIIGMTDLTLETMLSAEQREYLGMIKSSANSLLALINDILDFSKIEAGKLDLERIDFTFRPTLDSCLGPMAARAFAKKLAFRVEVAPEVPEVLIGDPGRLRQILLNLVGNAVKFTENGQIVVRAVVESIGRDQVRLQLSVSDTGIGIPREKLAVIFQPFIQADGSTTRKYGGTGLGLAICQHLVRLMGGNIWIDGEVGVGSTFTVSLPFGIERVRKPAPAVEPARIEINGHARTPLRILMAEDNPVNQLLVARLLEKRGHSVVTASNGIEALEALDREPFDLVLMDVQMPAMGGLEATAAIREREKGRDRPASKPIPIVAMTASAMKGDRERCLAAGMDGYVSKPIHTDVLFETIELLTHAGAEQIGKV